MIPLIAILAAISSLAILGAGALSWTVTAIAAALALIDGFLSWSTRIASPGARSDRSGWWSVDRVYLLALTFLLLTLMPMPLSVSRLTGRERYEQNARADSALKEAASLGLAQPATSFFAFTRNRAGTMRIAALLIAAYGIARLSSRLRGSRRIALLSGLVLLATAIGIAGFVSLRFMPQRDTLWWVYPIPHVLPGPVACFVNRNHFAGIMAMLSPAALALCVQALRARRWLLAPLWGFCFAALGLALLAAMSRGAFLAWLAGMGAVPLFFFPVRRALPAIACGAILAALLAWAALAHLPAFRERMAMLRDPEDSSVSARLNAWHDTLRIWRAYPVAGAGANAFRMVYPQHRTSSHTGFRTHAENQYVQLLAEGGIAGTALAALLIAACLLAVRRHARGGHASPALLAALGGGAAAAGVHALTDFALYAPLYSLALATLVGMNLPPERAALPRPGWLAALNLFGALVLLSNEPQVQHMENPGVLGNTTGAEARLALVWAPTHWQAWQRWGYLAGQRRGKDAQPYAARCTEQAARYDPLNFRLWQYLGYTRLSMKDYAGARAAFDRMHKLRPWVEMPKIPGT